MLAYLPNSVVIYLYLIFGLLGLVMGSALNCLSLRMSRGGKWAGNTRSACPVCGHVLTGVDLIPLFSWLALRGKCRYCKTPISARYPLTELLLAAVYVGLLLKYDLSLALITPVIFVSCLFCLSLIDMDAQIIPNRFLLIPAAVRMLELLATGGVRGLVTGTMPGLVIACSVLILSLIMDKALRKETMGGGDIKLLFVIGMFLPLGQCLLMVLVACTLGILMAAFTMNLKADTPFPFGPALSLAAVLTMFFGDGILSWYLSLF